MEKITTGIPSRFREVYKALERRWQTSPGFSFSDFSGWRNPRQDHVTAYRPLWIVIEDRATMQRIWVTQVGSEMEITYMAMDDKGFNQGQSYRIHCSGIAQMARELESLFTRPGKAA